MRAREVLAVVALTLGTMILLPLLGPLALLSWLGGVIALWLSDVWTIPEKVVATLVWPGGIAMPLFVGLIASRTCMTSVAEVAIEVGTQSMGPSSTTTLVCTGYALPSVVGIPVFAVMMLTPLVIGLVLLKPAKQRAALPANSR